MRKGLLTDNTVVSRTLEVVAADMDGETVMISIENGKYYGLNVIGSRIWELLAGPQSVAQMVQLLGDEYDVERERCRKDVLDFLNYLVGENLVKLG